MSNMENPRLEIDKPDNQAGQLLLGLLGRQHSAADA